MTEQLNWEVVTNNLKRRLLRAERERGDLEDVANLLSGRFPGWDAGETCTENVRRALAYLDDKLELARIGELDQ